MNVTTAVKLVMLKPPDESRAQRATAGWDEGWSTRFK